MHPNYRRGRTSRSRTQNASRGRPRPLAPDASRLISGFCSSPRSFGLGFFQTPPRGDALAVSLAFGSAKTWLSDLHRHSYVPCPAHTFKLRGAPLLARPSRTPCYTYNSWLRFHGVSWELLGVVTYLVPSGLVHHKLMKKIANDWIIIQAVSSNRKGVLLRLDLT